MQFESPTGGSGVESYVDPDQALGIRGSIARAPALENHQRELVDLITNGGGLVPARGDLTQVRQAIDAMIAAAVAAATLVAPGTIRVSAASAPAAGEFLCNGAAVNRVTYAALFTALGGVASPWGLGDGSTTFNLPDLRGRALLVAGAGLGLTARTLGDITIGAETHALTANENGTHAHDFVRELADSDTVAGTGNGHPVGDGNESGALVTITGASGRAVLESGLGSPHNNMQPSAVVNAFIHV